jgi:hypothetical protein
MVMPTKVPDEKIVRPDYRASLNRPKTTNHVEVKF